LLPILPQNVSIKPGELHSSLKKKLKRNGVLGILRDDNNGLVGIKFGYKSKLYDAFKTEEWENPILYSGEINENNYRKFSKLLKLLNATINKNRNMFKSKYWQSVKITKDTEVFIFGAVAIKPSNRGLHNFQLLCSSFYKALTSRSNLEDLLMVGETSMNSSSYILFDAFGVLKIIGFLDDEMETPTQCIILTYLADIAERAMSPLGVYIKRIKHLYNQQRYNNGIMTNFENLDVM
jgi:hypothetical protein